MHDASAQSWWDMTVEEVRQGINQRIMNIEAPTPPVAAIQNRCIENRQRMTPVRIYFPNKKKDLPLILFLHGGAWIAGNLDTHDNLARYLCSQTEAIVVSVGYTNAPEGKFPLQLQQSTDALTWMMDPQNALGADYSRLAVVGDSGGANMAAALCLMVRDQKGPKIDIQVLINPVLDLTCEGTIARQNDHLDRLRWQVVQYLENPEQANNPYISPLKADDLRGLPEAMIILSEKDDFRESGQNYADRLCEAGVPTHVYCQLGGQHLAGDGAKASFRARESLDAGVEALQKAFSKNKNFQLTPEKRLSKTPLKEGYLQVSEQHQIFYATYGNPQGHPVIVLHGGPGIGCDDEYCNLFDLAKWHVILLDQRGAMRSKPFACMEDNTTQNSVEDIEKLRVHLGIDKWAVFGHSWGSCLGLVYGETHPRSCLGFILEGIFLGRDADISFFRDMGKLSKTAYDELLKNIPLEEQNDLPQACYKRVMHPDPAVHMKIARALMRYQLVNKNNPPSEEIVNKILSDDTFILSFVRAFVHYAMNQCFLKPNQVLNNISKINHLPCTIVHGSLDTVCPLAQGVLLHENWPNSQLRIIDRGGHSLREEAIAKSVKEATDEFTL